MTWRLSTPGPVTRCAHPPPLHLRQHLHPNWFHSCPAHPHHHLTTLEQAYAASKWALRGFTLSSYEALRGSGVKVHAVTAGSGGVCAACLARHAAYPQAGPAWRYGLEAWSSCGGPAAPAPPTRGALQVCNIVAGNIEGTGMTTATDKQGEKGGGEGGRARRRRALRRCQLARGGGPPAPILDGSRTLKIVRIRHTAGGQGVVDTSDIVESVLLVFRWVGEWVWVSRVASGWVGVGVRSLLRMHRH